MRPTHLPQLDVDGVVESETFADFNVLGVGGLVSGNNRGGVAGCETQQEEREQANDHQNGDRGQQSTNDIGEQLASDLKSRGDDFTSGIQFPRSA